MPNSASHTTGNLNSTTPVLINNLVTTVNPITKTTQYGAQSMDLVLQNTDGSATVYLGASNVSSSSFGYKLAAGATLQLQNIPVTAQIYAISSASSSNLAVLQVLK